MKILIDLFALDKVSSLYDNLPTSCLGTSFFSLFISSLLGIPSYKVKAASHLVAITLSDLSLSFISFAKQTSEYTLSFFLKEYTATPTPYLFKANKSLLYSQSLNSLKKLLKKDNFD